MIRILSFSYKHMKAVEIKCTTEQYKGDREGVLADSYFSRFICLCTQEHLCLCIHIHTQTNIILKCLSFCSIVSSATHLWSLPFPFLQNQPFSTVHGSSQTLQMLLSTLQSIHFVLGDNFPHLNLASLFSQFWSKSSPTASWNIPPQHYYFKATSYKSMGSIQGGFFKKRNRILVIFTSNFPIFVNPSYGQPHHNMQAFVYLEISYTLSL